MNIRKKIDETDFCLLQNYVFAGGVSIMIGMVTTILVYHALGFITDPIINYIEKRLLGGVR